MLSNSNHLSTSKYNRNMYITAKLRGLPSSYDLLFLRNWDFPIFSNFWLFFAKNWLFQTIYLPLFISIFQNTLEIYTVPSKWGVYHLHKTSCSREIEIFRFLAIFSKLLQKLAVLEMSSNSDDLNISKYNRNIHIMVKMRGISSLYDLPFLRYEIWLDFLVKEDAKNRNLMRRSKQRSRNRKNGISWILMTRSNDLVL